MKTLYLFCGIIALLVLAVLSLFIGAGDVSPVSLFTDPEMQDIFFISRIPRTLSLILAGSAMSVAGLIMQLLTQNRFVEPSLAGTTQSASLGLLVVMVLFPAASIMTKMVVASGFALMGTMLFMVGAVISALTIFTAYYFDLLQSLGAWMSGDFSSIIQGRYELLWLVGILTLIACWIADSFTVAGMGREFSINVGLNYRKVMTIGLSIIALISGVVVVVVGALPFLGLIIPNLVSLVMGDNIRKTIPWICIAGGGLVLLCDIIGRLIRYPFEIPASVILGVVGAVIFLYLLLKQQRYAKS